MENIEAQPRDTVLRFFRYLDDQEYERIPALFIEDGEWHRRDKILKGHGEIRRSLADVPPIVPTVHLVTNLQFDRASETEVHATFYVTALRPLGTVSGPAPWPMDLPLLVTRYEAHLVVVAGAWWIKAIKNQPIFKR